MKCESEYMDSTVSPLTLVCINQLQTVGTLTASSVDSVFYLKFSVLCEKRK